MMEQPQDLKDYVSRLRCPMCGTPNGHGFSVSAAHEGGRLWLMVGKCLRCGFGAVAKFQSAELPTPAPGMAEISTDEVLDLHEALKAEDWLAQLTRAKS